MSRFVSIIVRLTSAQTYPKTVVSYRLPRALCQAIFKRCGPITQSSAKPTAAGGVSVRLTFKHEKDAKTAETQFDKQVADGKTLHVKVIGGVNASLTGRLGVGVQDGSVDVLLGESTGSSCVFLPFLRALFSAHAWFCIHQENAL